MNDKILNMGLPVERIMAEVEEEMLHMDEEVNGEPAEVEHMDELNEDLEKDLDGIAIEVVEGNKPFFLHRSTVRTFSSAPLNCLLDMMQSKTGCICYFSPPIFKSLL